jgi:hypothetical protein
VGAELLDTVGLATAVSDGVEDGENVLPPVSWVDWSGVGTAVVGLPDDSSEELGVGVVMVVLALVTVTVTGLPGFAVKVREGL